MAINIFNSVVYLEPHCKNCNSLVEYGETTSWSDDKGCHICNKCDKPVEIEEKDFSVDNETYVD